MISARFFPCEVGNEVDDQAGGQGRDGHRRDRAEDQRREETGIEESVPDATGLHEASRRELPGEDAVDPEQAEPGRSTVGGQQRQPGPVIEPAAVAVEAVAGGDLEAEEGPLGGPQPVELFDHHADGAGADLDRREPHSDTGQRAHDEADQHQVLKEVVDETACQGKSAGLCQPLKVAHQQSAADGELRQKHVKDSQTADHQTLHDGPEVVDREIGDVHGQSLQSCWPQNGMRSRDCSTAGGTVVPHSKCVRTRAQNNASGGGFSES